MERRVEATTVEGFVQQLAVAYVARGYYFYVTGLVPEGKDPARVDAKLCARYGVGLSKWASARRRAAGQASHAYIRYRRFFVLLATHGESPFFADEAKSVRDARRTPIRFSGYAISHRGGHVHVRIDRPVYLGLRAYLLGIAAHRGESDLAAEVRGVLDFEPYAPVRSQCRAILRAVNRARGAAGLPGVPPTCLRTRRRVVRPFRPPGGGDPD
jgi:hypothetical protein